MFSLNVITLIFAFLGVTIILTNFSTSKNKLCLIIPSLGLCLSVYKLLSLYININSNFPFISENRVFYADIFAGLILFTLGILFIIDISNKYYFLLIISSISCSLIFLFSLRTRTGYIAVTAGLIVVIVVLFYLRKSGIITEIKALKKKTVIISGVFIFAVVVSVILPSKVEDRSSLLNTFSSVFDKNYHSNKLRLIYWDASLKMFADYPLTGIGGGQWPGMFLKYSGDIFNDENKNMNLSYSSHNDYLEMIAEYGVWGLFYSIFIFTGIYFLFKVTIKDINYLPFLITAVGFSVTSFFNFTHENIWAMSLFMLCLGLGYGKYLTFRYRKVENIIAFLKNKPRVKYLLYTSFIILFGGLIIFKIYQYSVEKRYIAAINLKTQGNYKEMISELDKIPEWIYPVDMNKMPISFYRGAGNFELGNYEEALKDFRRARDFSKYYPTIMMNEASALYATGMHKEAIGTLKEMKELFPNFIEPQINLLSMYANLKMDNESKELIGDIDNRKFDPKYVKNYSVFVQIKNYFK